MSNSAINDRRVNKSEMRVLKLLSKSVRSGMSYRKHESSLLLSFNGREHSCKTSLISNLVARSFVEVGPHTLRITESGIDALSSDKDVAGSIPSPAGRKPRFSDSESPLYRLQSRRGSNGRRYFDEHEYCAGERLRRDFERGGLQPRVTSTLSPKAGRAKGGSRASAAEISDFAIDAQNRFRSAIACLVPELADVAIDVCCFLKGFETVEREKQWPPRSAKLMLKTALAQLSRHYGFSDTGSQRRSEIKSWGTNGYRPEIS